MVSQLLTSALCRARPFRGSSRVADVLLWPRASDRNSMGWATPRAQAEQGKRRAHLTSATAPAQCSIPSGFLPVLPGIAAAGRLSGQRGTGATVHLRPVGLPPARGAGPDRKSVV